MQINATTMLTMIDFLASRPSFDRVARQLVVTIVGAHNPRAALISVFEHDGALHAAGSFGLTEAAVLSSKKLSLWDNSPMSEAVRLGKPLAVSDTQILSSKFPWLENQSELLLPTVVWPLTLRDQQLGALELLFSTPPDMEALESDLTGIAPVLALYLSLIRSEASAVGQMPISPDGQPRNTNSQNNSPQTALTKRQEVILRLMSRGMTNAQIANRVGFSESTVRQETIAIYRFLGADGRHQAVQIASVRGLLEPTQAAGDPMPGEQRGS